MTQKEKFEQIGTAIQIKLDDNRYKIKADDFADKIMDIDTARRMYASFEFSNGASGVELATVARSYYHARRSGIGFVYHQNNGPLSAPRTIKEVANLPEKTGSIKYDTLYHCLSDGKYYMYAPRGFEEFTGDPTAASFAKRRLVTDTYGNLKIDCSTFAGLSMRGIRYENSPYTGRHGVKWAEWEPDAELYDHDAGRFSDMYSTSWAMKIADRQEAGRYNDIGLQRMVDGKVEHFSSLRSAADWGEYLYKTGYIIYDDKRDGKLIPNDSEKTLLTLNGVDIVSKLQPGDMLFWAKGHATSAQKKRFRRISHIAVVSEVNASHYYQVTGTEGKGKEPDGKNVVFYSDLFGAHTDSSGAVTGHNYDELNMVIRPDLRARTERDYDIGTEILGYPYSFATSTYTRFGLTFSFAGSSSINIDGSGDGSAHYFTLKGNTDGFYLRLPKGNYFFKGLEDAGQGTRLKLQIRKPSGTSMETVHEYYQGHGQSFSLTADTDAVIRLVVASGSYSNVKIYPSLVRES